MSKHTPGPWRMDEGLNITSTTGRLVASCGGYSTNVDWENNVAENTANAHLVCAAPELLQACKAALRLFEAIAPTSTPQSLVASTGNQLRAAIAKAQPRRKERPTMKIRKAIGDNHVALSETD